ncbi:hypothetical protein H310_06074 [Aphanomyces invadans]|uniref:EF-hand domain-containing protein n=1 Tax=Aphanomyces invadans TaxID=157072 RepID=A0A024U8J9_9STRA|nr:hypothetical protein H310_06074 [Aphanomyces invadans]ETW02604.1 hypothetical protein H310_06074 [Aphanomyces invadans]|eukprot:XP_008869209.1 hypothetical protein H310_06074 [Aphanomyces invadans]
MRGAGDNPKTNEDTSSVTPSLVSALIDTDLNRVFRFLRGYAARSKLRRLERELQVKTQAMASHAANDATPVPPAWGEFANDAYEIIEILGEGETEQLDALRREILAVTRDVEAAKADGPITGNDLSQALKEMNLPLSKAEVEHMIWEVDEDMDGCVSMTEFKNMFTRCVHDSHGIEPTQLYHVVQFLIYDQDFSFNLTGAFLCVKSCDNAVLASIGACSCACSWGDRPTFQRSAQFRIARATTLVVVWKRSP